MCVCVCHCVYIHLNMQRAGDIELAATAMEIARQLDTADRFVNCKCVKYFLRSNWIDQAVDKAGLFTRVRERGKEGGREGGRERGRESL